METPKDFGARWSFSAYTIREYCKGGLIKGAQKVGKSWRIPERALIGESPSVSEEPEQAQVPWYIQQYQDARRKTPGREAKSGKQSGTDDDGRPIAPERRGRRADGIVWKGRGPNHPKGRKHGKGSATDSD